LGDFRGEAGVGGVALEGHGGRGLVCAMELDVGGSCSDGWFWIDDRMVLG
jgi:hypothetical protein